MLSVGAEFFLAHALYNVVHHLYKWWRRGRKRRIKLPFCLAGLGQALLMARAWSCRVCSRQVRSCLCLIGGEQD